MPTRSFNLNPVFHHGIIRGFESVEQNPVLPQRRLRGIEAVDMQVARLKPSVREEGSPLHSTPDAIHQARVDAQDENPGTKHEGTAEATHVEYQRVSGGIGNQARQAEYF